jgi:Lon protease-like protein
LRTLSERYREPADLPQRIPVFPLPRAILLPRATLPLNIFEPRYLEMIEDVMAGSRILGMVQPEGAEEDGLIPHNVPLRRVGCAGRITAYEELEDRRLAITLTGVARFALTGEETVGKPYRVWTVDYGRFAGDFESGAGEDDVDREALLKALKAYLAARNLKADWSAVARSSSESLVNSLSLASPYGPEEKQALLEADTLKSRAEMLVALSEMELAAAGAGGSGTLQ